MPSDERTPRAVAATEGPRARFQLAVASAAAQVDDYLGQHRPADGAAAPAARAELGRFAVGRMDAERFASLLGEVPALDAEPAAALRRALDALRALHAAGDGPYLVDVPSGGDLRACVQRALGEVGRAFGAALAYRAVRSGVYRPDAHGPAMDAFPFARWSAAERELAPPIVVEVDGADLRGEALADLLDGRQRFVIVARGTVPGAPLARLITPDVFVMQTADAAELARLVAHDGPGIAALVPEDAARFVHDPDGGESLGERLTIHALPAEVPHAAQGGRSAWQLREEIAQLVVLGELAAPVEPVVGTRDAVVAAEPIAESRVPGPDALTAWLLREAGL